MTTQVTPGAIAIQSAGEPNALGVEQRMVFLRPHVPWSTLSDAALWSIADAMQPISFAAGDVIIRQGESGRQMHVLTSGRAQARVRAHGSAAVAVADFGPGDCFGEMAVLTGEATSADAVAVGRATTLALARASFDALAAADPGLLREFIRILAHRLRATDIDFGAAREREQELERLLLHDPADDYGSLVGRHPATKQLQRDVERLSRSAASPGWRAWSARQSSVVQLARPATETARITDRSRAPARSGRLVVCGPDSIMR